MKTAIPLKHPRLGYSLEKTGATRSTARVQEVGQGDSTGEAESQSETSETARRGAQKFRFEEKENLLAATSTIETIKRR